MAMTWVAEYFQKKTPAALSFQFYISSGGRISPTERSSTKRCKIKWINNKTRFEWQNEENFSSFTEEAKKKQRKERKLQQRRHRRRSNNGWTRSENPNQLHTPAHHISITTRAFFEQNLPSCILVVRFIRLLCHLLNHVVLTLLKTSASNFSGFFTFAQNFSFSSLATLLCWVCFLDRGERKANRTEKEILNPRPSPVLVPFLPFYRILLTLFLFPASPFSLSPPALPHLSRPRNIGRAHHTPSQHHHIADGNAGRRAGLAMEGPDTSKRRERTINIFPIYNIF